MPIYGYVCDDCGHSLDALQKMSEDPLTECPECGQSALKRQLSAPRFRLKGKGWYETDFKKDNQRNLAGDASDKPKEASKDKSDDKGSTKDSKKSDSKDSKSSGGKASAA